MRKKRGGLVSLGNVNSPPGDPARSTRKPPQDVRSAATSQGTANIHAAATEGSGFQYPTSRIAGQVDAYHGTAVPDPYRWLETLDSAETERWIENQNRLSQPYLESLATRDYFQNRLRESKRSSKPDSERAFLEALHERATVAGWCGDAWPFEGYLAVSVVLLDDVEDQLR